jgi:hypothetical protein
MLCPAERWVTLSRYDVLAIFANPGSNPAGHINSTGEVSPNRLLAK